MKNLSLILLGIWGFLLVSCCTDGNESLPIDESIESEDSVSTLPFHNGEEDTDADTAGEVAAKVNPDETDEWGE